MHKKVMLEYPDGKRHWGYATTEHSAINYGQPVIIKGNNVYGVEDIGEIQIIVNDQDVIQKLQKAGYNPISRTHVKKSRGVALPDNLIERIKKDSKKKNISFNQAIIIALEKYYNEKDTDKYMKIAAHYERLYF